MYPIDCPWCGRFMYHSSNPDDVFRTDLMCRHCRTLWDAQRAKDDPNEGARIQDEYDRAHRCPHCGEKAGFSFGTGDCGCESDRE